MSWVRGRYRKRMPSYRKSAQASNVRPPPEERIKIEGNRQTDVVRRIAARDQAHCRENRRRKLERAKAEAALLPGGGIATRKQKAWLRINSGLPEERISMMTFEAAGRAIDKAKKRLHLI